MGEGAREFAGMEEMGGVVRALGMRGLQVSEGFVEEMAAGRESAFDGGKKRAVEIVEAEDEIEAENRRLRVGRGAPGKPGFMKAKRRQAAALHTGREVGFDEHEAAPLCRSGTRDDSLGGDATGGGERGGAVESRGGEIHGDDGPAAFGEINRVLAGAAGEIDGAGMRGGAREQRETFDEERSGSGRRMRGGFAVAGVPGLEVVGHTERVNGERSFSQRRGGAKNAEKK